jgi:hypothetical protein
MKSFKNLSYPSFVLILLLISCTKNDTQNRSERFNLMQGRWNWKTNRNVDFNGPQINPPASGSYIQFNPNSTAISYKLSTPTSTPQSFEYFLLPGDSVFIKKITNSFGNTSYDTCKIDLLNNTQFVYHGIKTIPPLTNPPLLILNMLDSLYK